MSELRRRISDEYLAAGGDSMTPAEAHRHFVDRMAKTRADILALPLAERIRLLADFVEAGDKVPWPWAVALSRHILEEVERRA